MRKYILTCIALLVVSLSLQAVEPSALLYGNGKVQVFMGKSALTNAHAAAIDGDTITLSAGSFYVPDGGITKSVYICGSGAFTETSEQTIIDNNLTIKATNTILEGIRFSDYTTLTVNANDVMVRRCSLDKLSFFNYSNKSQNTIAKQCCIKKVDDMNYATSLLFYNCTIGYFLSSIWGINSDAKNSRVVNCVIYSSSDLPLAVFENNIIEAHNNYGLNSQSVFHNNLFYSTTTPTLNFPSGCEHTGDMFSTAAEVLNSQELYPAVVYNVPNGSDGKPVGIYGGEGFTPMPDIPLLEAAATPALVDNTDVFGKGYVTVNPVTNAPYLRYWWNDDYENKQDMFTYITWGGKSMHTDMLKVPASAHGKGPKKGVATLHIAALSSSGVMSAPLSVDITYAYGLNIEASSNRLTEGDVVTLTYAAHDVPISLDRYALYYSKNGGPWTMLDPDPQLATGTYQRATKFKGSYGTYRFIATGRAWLSNNNKIRTPLEDEWSVEVFFAPKN